MLTAAEKSSTPATSEVLGLEPTIDRRSTT